MYTLFTYFRPYFEHDGGVPIVLLFFLYGAFGIAGTLVGGVVVDRWGARQTLLLALGGCTIVFAALPWLARSPVGMTAAIVAWAITSWGFSPAVNRQLTAAAQGVGDIALALNLTAFNIGIALGSALGGATIALAGIGNLPYAAAALAGGAWLITLRTARN